MKPKVVHCKRSPHDVYIGRPRKWGNPFLLKSNATDAERAEAIEQYRAWIVTQADLLADLHELRGKVLGCWCAPKACHGDVLAELVELHCGT